MSNDYMVGQFAEISPVCCMTCKKQVVLAHDNKRQIFVGYCPDCKIFTEVSKSSILAKDITKHDA